MIIKYENSLGDVLPLSGGGVFADIAELFSWKLDEQEINGRISSFNRKTSSRKIEVLVYSSDRANQLRDQIYDISAIDTEARQYGKIWADEWYLKCYITAAQISEAWEPTGAARFSLTITSDNPVWRRDETHSIIRGDNSGSIDLDYPFNYPHDFATPAADVYIENRSALPSDATIRIYGGATSPAITVGDNRYAVGVTLAPGDYLEIDTEEKTVKVKRAAGAQENAFDKIEGEYMRGSGSYIFEKIPSGSSNITWDGSFSFDVETHEKRDVIRWSDATNIYRRNR